MQIVLKWADGKNYPFNLRMKELEELERIFGMGWGAIFQNLMLGTFKIAMLKDIPRLGLIGGGMGAVEAAELVDMYIGRDRIEVPLEKGPNSPLNLSIAIAKHVMYGMPEPSPGEAKARTAKSTSRRTAQNS